MKQKQIMCDRNEVELENEMSGQPCIYHSQTVWKQVSYSILTSLGNKKTVSTKEASTYHKDFR